MLALRVVEWVLTWIGMIGIPAATCLALGARRVAATVAGIAFAAWIAVATVLAAEHGFLTVLGKQPPWLPIAVIAVLVAELLAARIPAVSSALDAPGTLAKLVWPHTFRVAGLAMIIGIALGGTPALFALPAGLGDFAVGIAAPFVARRLAREDYRGVVLFSALGLLDLVVALTLGALTAFGFVHVGPVNIGIAQLPLALIPVTAVPLLMALHIVLIVRVRRRQRTLLIGNTASAPRTAITTAPTNSAK